MRTPLDPVEITGASGRKMAIHFGVEGRALFGFYHPPEGDPWRGVGVVLCPPIGTDRTRSDRAYRHLAERLAASGFACLRFDLSGTGDSDGDERSTGQVRRWLDDVGLAAAELRARSGAEAIVVAGLRMGATFALAHAAERGDVDSLVLWGPCMSGSTFVREITRLHDLYLRIEPHLAASVAGSGDGEEALGMPLPSALIEDLSRVDLTKVTRRPASRILVIDTGSAQGCRRLVEHLEDLGASAEVRHHPADKFLITASHRAALPDQVIDSIVGWLTDAYPRRTGSRRSAPRDVVASAFGERPLSFGSRHSLFGIFTPANPARQHPRRPAILILNAGCVNRSGLHRMHVRMARRWADAGFDVLRIDLSGIGDSPAPPSARENLTYPPTALDEIRDAIAAIGARPIVVVGHCSGGDYAFQAAAQELGLAGICIVNPRTFCVLDLASVEVGDGAPPAAPVDHVPRTLRRIAESGVETLLVVSRNDPGVAYLDAHAAEEMRALRQVQRFRRIDVTGADHAFTPVQAQQRLCDILTEHLVARHGSPDRTGEVDLALV